MFIFGLIIPYICQKVKRAKYRIFCNCKSLWYDESATIIGVYPNIFTVEENEAGIKKRYNFSYVDILTGTVGIAELETMTETAQ